MYKKHIVIVKTAEEQPHNDKKQEAWRFLKAKYTPLSEIKPASMVFCNEKQAWTFSHLALC